MSTRCNIIVTSDKGIAQYYHHCDGYWSGVGEELKEWFTEYFNKFFNDGGKKPQALKIMEELSTKNRDYEYERDFIQLHGDIEFLYEILENEECIKIVCYQYADITDWERSEREELELKREICCWAFYYQTWYDWYTEGKKKLRELLNEK